MSLTGPQASFVAGVSARTKIDPRVLIAWLQQEGADAPGGTGGFNYLNLKPTSGDVYASTSPKGFEQFSSVPQAVAATVRRIQMPFAAPIVAVAAMKPTPAQEIAAIASTGWDQDHYGGPGGPNLRATFASIFTPAALNDRYEDPTAAPAVAPTAGTGSAADAGSVDLHSVTHAVSSAAAGWVGDLTGWLTSSGKLVLAYMLLVGVAGGLFLTGLKGLGAPIPKAVPVPV